MNKIRTSITIDPEVKELVEGQAVTESRGSFSNMLEFMAKEYLRLKKRENK